MRSSPPPAGREPPRVVCVIHPNKSAPSETFIRNHVRRLPADVIELYGGWFPRFWREDEPILPPLRRRRLGLALKRRLLRISPGEFAPHVLAWFLRRHRVDVVLAEYGQTGVAVMGACELARVPLVVHFHGADAHTVAVLEAEGRCYPELFGSAAAVVAGSRHLANRLVELGCPREKIGINHHGVDTRKFGPGDAERNPPVFVAVGRFVEKKAPHLTLLAFSRVVAGAPDARLVMIGDGGLLEACRILARALGVAHAVRFLGAQPADVVAETMRGARAFVQHCVKPSNGDAESFGIVFAEAGACGLPSVGTRHDGIPEVVVDGETGLLVDEYDVSGMADAMSRLVADATLAGRLGRQARSRVCALFDLERSIAGLWGVLMRVQEHRPPSDTG